MIINEQIFREYDIRGYVDRDLSPDFAKVLGRAYGNLVSEQGLNNIGIGWDARPSSEPYARALAAGISESGIDVELTGMGPTPQLYFSLFQRKLGGGIQITGSHNPSDMNGFKVCVRDQTISGQGIQDLKRRVLEIVKNNPAPCARRGSIAERSIIAEYTEYLSQCCLPHMGDRKLKVVVDAGNGVGGMVGPTALRALGIEVVELYCEPDGSFPNHHPDPTELENLKDLSAKVRETKADFGIGWDGDADRIGLVDELGEPVFGDMILLIYAREILKENPGATVIADVKSSQRLFDDLAKKGANPIMWKTGHSLMKSKLRETGALVGGEMSGHMFFKHRWFGFDDAIYATLRFVEIMSKTTKKVSQMISDLPPAVSTPEIRVDCAEDIKFQIPARMKEKFSGFPVETIDGVRVKFPKGWGLARASNTQPVLVMRFEAESPVLLEEYRKVFLVKLEEVKKELKG